MSKLSSKKTFSPGSESDRQVIAGYTAFIAALLLAILAKGSEHFPWEVVVSLLAVSLPSLVVGVALEPKLSEGAQSGYYTWFGLACVFGFTPSLCGISLLVWHFSAVAGSIFVVLCITWIFVLYRLASGSSSGP